MKPVIVIGYRGGMGRRYTAILDYLGHPWFGIEAMGVHYDGQKKEYVSGLHVTEYHSIIICTPTQNHIETIRRYKTMNLPMLCEKPVSFNCEDIEYIVNNKINVSMVNQYKYLSGDGGPTYYNYYNSGRDGLEWDCINIIGMAKDKAYIDNKSVTWECCINGKKLTLEDVNQAYIEMIKDWLENQEPDYDYLTKAHRRSKDGHYEKNSYRDTGENNKRKITGQSTDANIRKNNGSESDKRMHEKRGIHSRQK